MIHNERVISSASRLPLLVNEALSSLPYESLLLDVGAGDGRLGASVASARPDVRVVGMEYDESLALTTAGSNSGRLVVADARAIPFANKSFDAVTVVNTLHEVVNASNGAERAAQLEVAIGGLSRVLKQGGTLIIHDGLMPDSADESLFVRPVHQRDGELFARFGEEYIARPALIEPMDEQGSTFKTDMATAVTFLTKLNYLLEESAWEGERQQLYPFTDLKGITNAMTTSGMEVESVTFPEAATRNGLRKLLANYAITRVSDGMDYTIANFPACQVLLKGRKI